MIELFARTDYFLEGGGELTPLHIDDSVSSLSAILLNDAYYQASNPLAIVRLKAANP